MIHNDHPHPTRPGMAADCTSHTIPDGQLAAFLEFILEPDVDNPTNDVIAETAQVLRREPGNKLARLTVTALGLDDVRNENTAILYAAWVLADLPGLVTLADRGAYPRATDPERAP